MRKRRWTIAATAVLVTAIAIAAGLAMAGSSQGQGLTKVTLQSKWVVQSQFAGYYAAKAKGYYKQVGLDVNIKAGGPDILPEQVVLGKQAEFGINWMPSLRSRSATPGTTSSTSAQVYARSGTTEVTFKSSGINTFKKMRGKKFGVWIFGNEFEQRAALVKNGMNPDKDVQLVKQNFDMLAFLNGEIDAASAMTYNELAQVLETKNPDTGQALHALATSTSSSTRTSARGCSRTASSSAATGSRTRRTRRPRSSSSRRRSRAGSTAVTTSPSARTSC